MKANTRKYKIVFTVTNDLSTDQRMIRICSTLADAGYEVTLVGRKLNNSEALQSFTFAQQRINCMFTKGKFFYLEYNIRLFIFLLFFKTDVICSIDLDTILPGFLVSKLRGKKFIYDAHEYFPYVPEVIERPFTQKVWLLIERMTVPKADLAYTVSQSLAAEFESVYKRPFEVIRNVPFEREQIKCDKTDKIIIYQGALNAGRGLEQLLLATVGTDWKIYIFGDGDIKPILSNMMAELNLENNVFLKGKLSPSILWQETQKAYIGINLAEDKSLSYKLSLSNKLFDYIQAGVPQVMINLPEFVHLNEQLNFGIIIHSLEANEIRTAINRLLNDDDLYQNLVKNCISLKEVHNWENESKKIVNLYDALFR